MLSEAELKQIEQLLDTMQDDSAVPQEWLCRGAQLLHEVRRLQAEVDRGLGAMESLSMLETAGSPSDTHVG